MSLERLEVEELTEVLEPISEPMVYVVKFYPLLKTIPRRRRAKRAVRYLRERIGNHVTYETEVEKGGKKVKVRKRVGKDHVRISPEVSKAIRSRGAKKPPRRLRVVVIKFRDIENDEVRAYVYMPNEPIVKALSKKR